MPKNPHPPRGGGSKKPAPASSSNIDDTSFIVFSNAKGDPKKGKKVDNAAKDGQDIKGKGKAKQVKENAPAKKARARQELEKMVEVAEEVDLHWGQGVNYPVGTW